MFNADGCGLRLIPSTDLWAWVELMQYKHPKEGKLFAVEAGLLLDKSISPTEEQFCEVIGREDIEFED